jgi:hypothetical protein
MKKLFLAASGIFAAIPGLVILQTGLGTPPGDGYKMLFGGTIEAFGALILLLLWVNRKSIRRMRPRRLTKCAVTAVVICFVSITLYVVLYSVCVQRNEKWHGTVYFPLWLDGEVAEMVADKGGRNAAIDEYGPRDVSEAINRMPGVGIALPLTTILHLLLYQFIFTSLAAAFGLLGIHQGHVMAGEQP